MKIGIDIIKNKRVKLEPALIKRILSIEELKIFNSFDNKKRKQEFVAGRWAAKEAIYKANPVKLGMSEVTILNDEKGQPYIFNDELKHINLSISHEKQYTVAVAVQN